MADPGWYRDPDGTPGRFRYWTGESWSTQTTTDPSDPVLTGHPAPPAKRSGRGPIMIIIGVVIVTLAVIIALLIRDQTTSAIREPEVLPSSQTSGWDDSSPLPTESPSPTASPSTSTPAAAPTGRSEACDKYTQDGWPEPPNDGRVHGGPLSFEELGGEWSDPRASARFPYSKQAYAQAQTLPEELGWEASAYVGISTVPEGLDGESATDRLLQCVVTSDFYTSVNVEVTDNSTNTITVDGTRAVRRDSLLRFEHPQLETTGSRLRIIVVDSSPRTFYFHAVPMERDDLITELDDATESLRLD